MGYHIGYIERSIRDQENQIEFPVGLLYPTDREPQEEKIDHFTINATFESPVADGKFPLVLISHGSGGNPYAYLTIAFQLVRQGVMVAIPEHYGNNRLNNDLEGNPKNLTLRPFHLILTIDQLMRDRFIAPFLVDDRIGIIGHSIGGCTALSVAGGEPWLPSGEPVKVMRDYRIKALVLMAPATLWFTPPESLKQVDLPILLLTGEHDYYTPRQHADIVMQGVADPLKVIHREIANAGHFSFLSPFPSSMNKPNFPPAHDPEGFDRFKFHQKLPLSISGFFERSLVP